MNRKANSSHYDLLEVNPQATADDIKRAYYRKIRVFTNEAHPQEFMELRKAYETLSDAARRRDYDTNLNSDPLSLENREKIQQYMNNGHEDLALRLIKKEILRSGLTQELLVNRILCERSLENFYEVLNQSRSLDISTIEGKEFFYFNVGIAYRETGSYTEAEEAACELMKVSPEMANFQRLYASVFYYQNKYNEIKSFYNKIIKEKNLNVEHVSMLLDYITLQDKVGVSENEKRKLVYAILSLPKNEVDREAILYQMLDYIHVQEWIAFSRAREICDLAEQMNTQSDVHINNQIQSIRDDINQQDRPNKRQQSTEQPAYDNQSSERFSAHQPATKKGNIIIAIILGLILTGPLTIVGGIIGGIIYYHFADKIWNLIGCLIIIAIFIGVISLIFG